MSRGAGSPSSTALHACSLQLPLLTVIVKRSWQAECGQPCRPVAELSQEVGLSGETPHLIIDTAPLPTWNLPSHFWAL
jgi:hypothetical protein